jgi:hypothetical protein
MNYGELKTAIFNWVDHDNSDSVVDTWVELARAKINRRLRTRHMTCVAPATGDGVKIDFDLPSNWAGARQVSVDSKPAEYFTPERFEMYQHIHNVTNNDFVPTVFTIRANKIRFFPPPGIPSDGNPNIVMAFYGTLLQLVNDDDIDWLLLNYPDVWLYGSLVEAFSYVLDEERSSFYQTKFTIALDEVKAADSYDRWSGGALAIKAL